MKQNSGFIYKKPSWNQEQRRASFFYRLEHEGEIFNFTETLTFPSDLPAVNISRDLLNNVLQNLSLALGVSYYKLYCPRQIFLEGITLSKEQADFWNTVYTKGLGEFFYKNKIDFRGLVDFPFSNEQTESTKCSEADCKSAPAEHRTPPNLPLSGEEIARNPLPAEGGIGRVLDARKDRSLVGIGGGKDSIVAAEMLKALKKPFAAFIINSHTLQKQVADIIGTEVIFVKREIDPKLLELNKRQGVFNGHVPVSSIYAFIGLLTALLYGYHYVVVGNEKSANYGNTEYLGEMINHQWSKSLEFEKMFQDYVSRFITADAEYFSLLRPISEIAIVERFVDYPQYFPVFSSCNKNFKITEKAKTRWCGECPKCAFSFAILAAFLSKSELIKIFGQNLFDKTSIMQTYKELLGTVNIKPFECVGTPEEVMVSFYLAMKRGEYENDMMMRFYKENVLPKIKNIDIIKDEVFVVSDENRIPKEFQEVVR